MSLALSLNQLALTVLRRSDCFHAPAIARSKISNIDAESALKVAILMAYGWINRIVESTISHNEWPAGGIFVTNSANSIIIRDNAMEGNGWGISMADGMNIDVSGNCIEGTGGPAIIAGGTSGLRVAANYFGGCT